MSLPSATTSDAGFSRVFDRARGLPQRFDPERTIFFHAIENAGSSSFNDVMLRAFAHFASQGHIDPRRAAYAMPNNGLRLQVQELMLSLHERQLFYHYLGGHFLFGAQRYWCRPSTFVTVFREPVTRMLSSYNFYRHYARPEATMPLLTYLRSFDGRWSTLAARVAFEYHPTEWAHRNPSPAEIEDRAWENLAKHFSFVGISELFDESLFLFCEQVGLPAVPPWQRVAHLPNRPEFATLSEDLQAELLELTRIDRALYDHYRDKLLRQFRQRDFGQEFLDYQSRASGR